jgi:hypothetical protein
MCITKDGGTQGCSPTASQPVSRLINTNHNLEN